MCQGVIVSLVEFKNQQVILSGIGSHSQLLKDNKQLLIDRGWAEDNESQKVFSIESDFTNGYGKFTIESGEPDDKQLELLTREYLNCAGTDRALIDHVKRCGKIDDSLVKLLTRDARKQYEEARAPILKQREEAIVSIRKQYEKAYAPIWKQYDEAYATIWKQYDEARALIQKQYEEAIAPIRKQYYEARAPIIKKYDEALAPIRKQYDDAMAPIWKQYDEAHAPIWKQYYEARAPIRKQYQEARAPILKQYEEARAPILKQYDEAIFPIWVYLFEIPENRIDVMKQNS